MAFGLPNPGSNCMKTIVVIVLNLPTPEDIITVLEHINPPQIPFFGNEVRIVIDPHATELLEWLEE